MKDHDPATPWFAAQLKPNSHQIAQRNLARQGFRVFLPLEEETRRTHGKFVTRLRPLFPGYIFVALDRASGSWRAVNSTYGITRLISLGAEPTPVPTALIDALMRRCDDEGLLLPPEAFQVGDQVVVAKGPFTDLVATIEMIDRDERIVLLMELMGGQTRVSVSPDHLRKAD
ncbi:MAG: transcriptional activator RfaH [Rubellimicrobium sp.]|nr:transcriptional activator RfaH [Rubellimicrobium sp.]